MDYRDNRQRWAESHQVVHFYAGQWCTFTPALTVIWGMSDETIIRFERLLNSLIHVPNRNFHERNNQLFDGYSAVRDNLVSFRNECSSGVGE